MPSNTPIKLNEEWIYERLCDVTKGDMAWVLLQEPGFVGFGIVRYDDILWPPNKSENSPDWCLVNDLRLFGKRGEWHVWRDWNGKHQCRLLEFGEKGEWNIWLGPEGKKQSCPEKYGKKINTITEYHALWGNDVEAETNPWIKLVEDRGTEIWLPLTEFNLKAKSHLPLRLKLKQIIDYDPKSHLAGIVDAALVGLVCKSDKKLLIPSMSDCLESETSETAPCCPKPDSSDTSLDA